MHYLLTVPPKYQIVLTLNIAMRILQELLTAAEIQELKQHWQSHTPQHYLNQQMEDGTIIDHRLKIIHEESETRWEPVIDRIIMSVFDQGQIIKKWAALQRQTNPHHQHIDDFAKEECEADLSLRMYTFIVALDTIPEFKTIVWKEGAPSNAVLDRLWRSITRKRKNRLSEQEDLDHIVRIPFEDQQVALTDFLTVDGIFPYQAGWACLFNGKQVHTTSYWLKYPKHSHRDLLQIHVLTRQHLEDWHYLPMPDQIA
jgi:hypothetical protein